MCGRFTQNYSWEEVYNFLNLLGTPRNLRPRYNIAPTTSVDVVRLDKDGERELVSMRWGLVPFFWKKKLRVARDLQLARRNCRRKADVPRVPQAPPLHHSGERLFRMDGREGRWDRWIDPETKEEILSCTIIVSAASEWMTIYHDCMPVLLHPMDFDAWLDGSLGAEGLRPAAESALREWTVSKRVNRTGVGDGDPTILERSNAA